MTRAPIGTQPPVTLQGRLESGMSDSRRGPWPRVGLRRHPWPLAIMALASVLVIIVLALGLRLNLSRSLPRGLYRMVAEAPTRGALVGACVPRAAAGLARERAYLGAGDCPGDVQAILKQVGAVTGDVVELGPDAVTVNGQRLPRSETASRDSHGRPLPHAPWGRHVVAPGEVWLFSTWIPQSWDSRYFGPVPRDAVRATVRAVLTVE